MTLTRVRWPMPEAIALTTALVLTTPALAQEAPAPPSPPKPAAEAKAPEAPPRRGPRPGDTQRVFVIQHANVRELARVLGAFPAEISYSSDPSIRAVAVSAAPAVVAVIAETIKRLDVPPVPPKGVEITGYVLECGGQPGETGGTPAELESVVTQLRQTFSYSRCSLADTLIARGVDGSWFETRGVVARDKAGLPTSLRLRGRVLGTTAGDGTTMPLRYEFELMRPGAVPTPPGSDRLAFDGDVRLREGQRVVVGKTAVEGSGNALFLVLTARVVD